ncbi:hypothetical protein ACU61O_12605 [Klebsiella aerogenes]|uniref:hypothetical protein n=1 Tax=Klebsiella aerogenes TaxID=548 RepID=UPI001F60A2E2|nr:hypothetical protein [Klebsiella aerogenes]EKU4512378.1 hypothetical protein [Klebsiella aerogenes]
MKPITIIRSMVVSRPCNHLIAVLNRIFNACRLPLPATLRFSASYLLNGEHQRHGHNHHQRQQNPQERGVGIPIGKPQTGAVQEIVASPG